MIIKKPITINNKILILKLIIVNNEMGLLYKERS